MYVKLGGGCLVVRRFPIVGPQLFPDDLQTSTLLGFSILFTVSSVISSTSGLISPSADPCTCSRRIFISVKFGVCRGVE